MAFAANVALNKSLAWTLYFARYASPRVPLFGATTTSDRGDFSLTKEQTARGISPQDIKPAEAIRRQLNGYKKPAKE